MELLRFAAIDIGTNAIRLLFTNVIEDNGKVTFKKSSMLRVPIRLGEDVFEYGEIKPHRISCLIHAMEAFRHLMYIEDTVSYRGCATSAMREARNGKEVVQLIKETTGIDIEVIDGKEEAKLLYKTHINKLVKKDKPLLYVDVGGGSTEITLFDTRNYVISHSFNIGTIRMLRNQVKDSDFKFLKKWLQENIKDKYPNVELIGAGGNINRIFKMTEEKSGTTLTYKTIDSMYQFLTSFSIDERIKTLGLNPDRADVIIPAAELFLKIMKWAGIEFINVPKIGLVDGIVRQQYATFRQNENFIEDFD